MSHPEGPAPSRFSQRRSHMGLAPHQVGNSTTGAYCPAGSRVVGGGFAAQRAQLAKLMTNDSWPVTHPDGRERWEVVMHNIGPASEAFGAIAYCVSTSKPRTACVQGQRAKGGT